MRTKNLFIRIGHRCFLGGWFILLAVWSCEEPASRHNHDEKTKQARAALNKSAAMPAQVTQPAKTPQKAVEQTKVNRQAQHILLIGDSMAGAAGLEYGFRKYAAYNGHRLTVVSQASSHTAGWSTSKQLKTAIAIHKPTYVIVVLGANELFVQDIPQRKEYIKDIIKQAGDTPVIWAGPPNWRKDTGINEAILAVVGKDRFFPSENVKITRQSDGIHPNLRGSVAWSDALSKWIMTESKHKIRLENPAIARRKSSKKIFKK
ncbi:SGNH/GDSL hydrolase family protein [Microscilla marina]|uniref:SGNH/GDSL hydrolase family protein n=1 Tax=Microscilla marina TaxID=1027 RepID=UPI0006A74687|nr:SGNH/GDSL hydrolase family protein [Microscilla marina]